MTDLITTTERITPAKAEKYLNENKGNRSLREGVAEKYAADMAAGKWTVCAAPIVFYENGDLADGQHRLYAVIESGTTQTFSVVRNFPREAGLNIDTGLTRSLVDNGRISGADTHLSHGLIAAARAINDGTSGGPGVSNAAKLEIVTSHREAAQFAMSYGPKGKGLRNAVVLGAVGRAWYHEDDKDKLRRFGEVVTGGFASGETESAAVAIRNYMMSKGRQASTGGNWRDTFLKVQNAIWYFMRGKSLTYIRTVVDEAYPLAGTMRQPSGGHRKVAAAPRHKLVGTPKKAAVVKRSGARGQ